MPIYRATARLNRVTAVPRDASVNVFHVFSSNPMDQDLADALGASFSGFYNTMAPFIGSQISRGTDAHIVEFAALSTGQPGVGDDTAAPAGWFHPFTLSGVNAGTNLPSEVAACLSWRAAGALNVNEEGPGGTRPRARKRGRTYVGPLTTASMTTIIGSNIPIFNQGFCEALVEAGIDLLNDLAFGDDTALLCVYSPTSGQYQLINHAHVDNAPDTIRSRGEVSNFREERDFDLGVIQEIPDQVFG